MVSSCPPPGTLRGSLLQSVGLRSTDWASSYPVTTNPQRDSSQCTAEDVSVSSVDIGFSRPCRRPGGLQLSQGCGAVPFATNGVPVHGGAQRVEQGRRAGVDVGVRLGLGDPVEAEEGDRAVVVEPQVPVAAGIGDGPSQHACAVD